MRRRPGFAVLSIAALTVVVSLICGIVPALHAARTRVSPFLRGASSPRWAAAIQKAITESKLVLID